MAVDSGACENVIDAEEMVRGFEIKQTKASMSGVKYASATGEEILNLGEVVLPVITAEGTKRRMRLQAAEVSRPLASVKRICEASRWRDQRTPRGLRQLHARSLGSADK